MIRLVTIGVYGSTERKFFDALVRAKVDVFCDIRLRRGMRGATYSFANSSLLQRTDHDNMMAIARDPKAECPECVLIIISIGAQTSEKAIYVYSREKNRSVPLCLVNE